MGQCGICPRRLWIAALEDSEELPREHALMVEAQTRQVSFARHTSHTIVPSRGGRGSATQWLRPPPGQRASSFQAVIFSRSNSLLRSGNESFQPLRLFVLDIGLTSS